jgi:hypothetical protein
MLNTRGQDAAVRFVLGSVSSEAIHAMDPHIAITLIKANLSPA